MNSDPALIRHNVRFEPPDLIVSSADTKMTLEEATAIWKFIADSTINVERYYWVADISKFDRAPPIARTDDVMRTLSRLHGLACFHGNFAQRTIFTVALRAARLLGRMSTDSELAFFNDEATARAWVESMREKTKRQASR